MTDRNANGIGAQPHDGKAQLESVRAAALNRMLWTIGLLGGLVLSNAVYRILLQGEVALAIYYVSAYVGIIAFLGLTRARYRIRALVPISILFSVGVSELVIARFNSLALLYLLAVVMITGALFGVRAAYVAVAASAATILLFGLFDDLSLFGLTLPPPRDDLVPLAWRGALLNFCMLAVVASALFTKLLEGLQQSIQASQEFLAKLQAETAERERAENELRQTRDFLDAAVSQSHAGIVIADAPGVNILLANKAALDARGGDPSTLIGINLEQLAERWQTFYPDGTPYAPEDLPLARAVLKGEHVREEEVLLLNVDGEQRAVLANATPILDDAQSIVAGVVVFQDITELKRILGALRESEERYRAVFEQANDGILLYRDGVVRECNRRALELNGMTRDQLIGASIWDISPPAQRDGRDSRERALELIEQARQGNRMVFEWVHLRSDGTPFDVEVSISFVESASEPFMLALWRDISERKALESSIHERDVRLRGIVETSRDWIWAINLSGRHTYCNPAIREILGYEPEELLESPSLDFLHQEDRAHVESLLPTFVQERRGWQNLLLRWRHKDGSYRCLESNAVTILDSKGALIGFQGVDRDITERIESEQAMRESEERYRSLFESASDAIFLMKGQTFIDCNPRTLEMFGCTREQILGQPPYRFSPRFQPNGMASLDSALEKISAAMEGHPQFFEWQHCRLNETVFDTEVSLNRLYLRKEPYVLAIVRDVTDRKRTQEALRRSEVRNTAILEVLPDIMFCLDRNGTHLDFHVPVGEKLFVPLDQIIGNTVYDLLPREVADEFLRRIALTIDKDSMEVFEYQLAFSESDVRVYEARMVPQEFDVVLTIVRNITERKQSEKNLARYRDRLEDLVAERTDALKAAQEELVRKERLAALGTLTATVAHEIRNPLGTVQNAIFSIGDATKKGDQARAARALVMAENNIRRCNGIISELLDFTRKRQLARIPTNMDRWLESLLEEQPPPEDVTVTTDLSTGIPLLIDPEHLRRAVICVYNNAVQAVKSEGATDARVRIVTRRTPDRFEIRIEDSGPGIPESLRAKIFEPLFSTKSFGVGLGVPIAQDIMFDHGGGLQYESLDGNGTAAILWLPLGESAP